MVDATRLDQARVVAEDLAYLCDEWEARLDAPALRRLSPVLRRLLVNGDYAKAWRAIGLTDEPYVTATDLDAMLGSVDRTLVQVALAPPGETVRGVLRGGGDLQLTVPKHIAVGSVVFVVPGLDEGLGPILAATPPDQLSSIAADPAEAARESFVAGLGRRVARGLSVTAYLRSPAALVGDVVVSRQDVVIYVANKLGGAHFDPKREGKTGRRLAALDLTLAKLTPTGGQGATFAYAELLSIAESIAESSDAARFRRVFRRLEQGADQ